MLPLALIGGLIVTAGAIMIVSPLWISEQKRRNLAGLGGPATSSASH